MATCLTILLVVHLYLQIKVGIIGWLSLLSLTTISTSSHTSKSISVVEGTLECAANSGEASTAIVMSICIGEHGLDALVGCCTKCSVEG